MTYRTFTSWNEIKPGDILSWNKRDDIRVEFIKYKDYGNWSGRIIEHPGINPRPVNGIYHQWCDQIFAQPPKHALYKNEGWVLVDSEVPYDPSQEPDDEDDV